MLVESLVESLVDDGISIYISLESVRQIGHSLFVCNHCSRQCECIFNSQLHINKSELLNAILLFNGSKQKKQV